MKTNQTTSIIFATAVILICLVTAAQSVWAKSKAAASSNPNPLEAISGRWYTEGHEGGVELYPCDDQICGRFSWIKNDTENGTISHDKHNPDAAQRERPLCHMQFMGNFTPDGENQYTGGWIYNPRDGGTYSAELTLIDHDTLDLHGYLFFPFLGQSQTWKRATTMPSCLGD